MVNILRTLFSVLCFGVALSLDNTEDEELMMKKTKVLACIAITKSRMAKDVAFMDKLTNKINKQFSIDDGRNKVLSLCLVNCYGRITQEQAFEIITSVHSGQNVDGMTETNINLLGLQDMEQSARELSEESFVRNFQEINIILRDLNTEHDKIKNNQPDAKNQKKGPTTSSSTSSSSSSSFITILVSNLVGFFYAVSRLVQIDNYFGLGLMILAAFFLLQFIFSICRPHKRKRVNNNNSNNNEARNTAKSPSDAPSEKLD